MGEIVHLPTLGSGDQARPEDGAAAEVELGLLPDVELVAAVAGLPERVAGEVLGQAAVGEAAEVVGVCGVEIGARFQNKDALALADPFRQIIGQQAAADA